MTTDEAKYAVISGAAVMYTVNGIEHEWQAVAIITQIIRDTDGKGWRNSLRLVDPKCGHSITEARMRECRLKNPMPSGT